MASRSVSNIILKPIIFGLLSFFIIFFFFPTFSQKYIGVGYANGSVDGSEKVEELKDIVSEKTGANLDDVVDAANSEALKGLLDTGVKKGKEAVTKITYTVRPE